MKITAKVEEVGKAKTDLLVFGLFEDDKELPKGIYDLGMNLDKEIQKLVDQIQIKKDHGAVYTFPTFSALPAKSIAIIGLGKKEQFDLEKLRQIGGTIAKVAKDNLAKTVTIDSFFVCHSESRDSASSPSRAKSRNEESSNKILRELKDDKGIQEKVHELVEGLEKDDKGSVKDGKGVDQGVVEEVAQALAEGLYLGNYQFKEYKTASKDDPEVEVESAVLLVENSDEVKLVERGISRAKILSNATMMVRDLVNRPASHLHPVTMKEAAEKITKDSNGLIKIEVLGREKLKKMGAGGILGVASGSEFEPFLIHLHYIPVIPSSARDLVNSKADEISRTARNDKGMKSVAIVGKGVTFDSGGLSIKPAEAMEDMKSDMAGAATVLGVFKAITDTQPNVEIHGFAPVVENMVSDRSMRVGDILRTLSGKTVEVQNTDAEGRLILADALTYAETFKPDVMVDLATLTGAAIVALGDLYSAVMGDKVVVESLMSASEESGERLCELPLVEEYKEKMKSEVADLSNIHKGKGAGTIMGGLFLKEFVKDTPWVHIDIAGPSFSKSGLNSYTPSGGTGAGVRLILSWLENIA